MNPAAIRSCNKFQKLLKNFSLLYLRCSGNFLTALSASRPPHCAAGKRRHVATCGPFLSPSGHFNGVGGKILQVKKKAPVFGHSFAEQVP